ncbi:MAG: hypothetical protein J0I43_07390 [Microbacterium sp.]|uniref:hypothetical protein n=1 Tax=Microbacterium sp. TaxID=51671 RepID=UPI001AC9E316|nr:hypothetical protein [Microbacterium sp.]MBN9177174.1 hypothetical protein [Microbacterium sp.]
MTAAPPSLLDPQTALRRLSAEEAPYAGWLHTGSPPTVWADLEQVPDDVWRCARDGHILVPIDLARSGSGLAAVVPHCPARLGLDSADRATPGAAVTIAVSVLRAAAEARSCGMEEGSWWLDASGRPVLAVHDGASWADDGRDLLERLALGAGPVLASALARAGELLAAPRWRDGDLEECEERLFAAAEPEPLHVADAAPGEAGVFPLPLRATTARADRSETAPDAAESWLARFTDAAWAARVAAAVRDVAAIPGHAWSRVREGREQREHRGVRGAREHRGVREARASRGGREEKSRNAPSTRRRAPLLVAAAVAAVVIGGGLLWPEPEPTAGAAPGRSVSLSIAGSEAPATAPTEPSPTETRTSDASAPTDPATELEDAALDIVRALARCADAEAEVCAALLERPETATPAGVVSAGAADTAATLLDEYGGVAVFRIEAAALEPQVLVLVSANGKWLVRDVYDVADQP